MGLGNMGLGNMGLFKKKNGILIAKIFSNAHDAKIKTRFEK